MLRSPARPAWTATIRDGRCNPPTKHQVTRYRLDENIIDRSHRAPECVRVRFEVGLLMTGRPTSQKFHQFFTILQR